MPTGPLPKIRMILGRLRSRALLGSTLFLNCSKAFDNKINYLNLGTKTACAESGPTGHGFGAGRFRAVEESTAAQSGETPDN